MENPLVTIVIPVYNMAGLLPRMLRSIRRQNFTNYEVICVNDRSTDKTEEVLKQWQQQDSRIIYVNNKTNMGECPSRNVGIRLARGRYLMNADPDDEYPENVFQRLVELAERYGSDMVRGGITQRMSNGSEKSSHLLPRGVEMYINTNFNRCRELQRIPAGHVCSLYRTNLFEKFIYPENVGFGCDMIFNVLCYLNAKKITIIKDIVYIYNYNQNSATNSNININKIKSSLIWRENMYKILNEYGYDKIGLNFYQKSSNFLFKTYLCKLSNFNNDDIIDIFILIKNQHKRLNICHYNSHTIDEAKIFFELIYNNKFENAKIILKDL